LLIIDSSCHCDRREAIAKIWGFCDCFIPLRSIRNDWSQWYCTPLQRKAL